MKHPVYEAFCRCAINETEMDKILANYDDSYVLSNMLIDALALVHSQNDEIRSLEGELFRLSQTSPFEF